MHVDPNLVSAEPTVIPRILLPPKTVASMPETEFLPP